MLWYFLVAQMGDHLMIVSKTTSSILLTNEVDAILIQPRHEDDNHQRKNTSALIYIGAAFTLIVAETLKNPLSLVRWVAVMIKSAWGLIQGLGLPCDVFASRYSSPMMVIVRSSSVLSWSVPKQPYRREEISGGQKFG